MFYWKKISKNLAESFLTSFSFKKYPLCWTKLGFFEPLWRFFYGLYRIWISLNWISWNRKYTFLGFSSFTPKTGSHEIENIYFSTSRPHTQDLQLNYFLVCNSYDVNFENLVFDQLIIIPWLIFFFILITSLLDIVFMLQGKKSVLATHGS